MDQINQPVDIILDHHVSNDYSNDNQMIQLPQFNFISKRPLYSIQQRNILSIRQYFQNKNWLLLSTYGTMNTMYLCSKTEFEQKVSEHLIQTKAYTLMKECSDMNQNDLKIFFNDLIQQIDYKLTDLLEHDHLTMEQYIQMMSTNKRDENQINSVIFLPDIRMQAVSFRPMLLNASGPIIYIAQYLHQILYTSYCLVGNSTTFHNGIDVVQTLETFTKKGLLQSTTQFITLEIKDFDIIFTHQQIIKALKYFLSHYNISYHQSITTTTSNNLSNKTIITLVELILKMQYFIYDNKIYQQTKGGNINSPLIQLLVNIYLFYWQKNLQQVLKRRKELFGRCYNKMFFTWNGSKRQFHSLFHKIKGKLPDADDDLPIQLSIGTSISYLDVEISQSNGILQTKIYRPGLIEQYTLPYLIKYSSNQYASIIRAHLIHTIQLCTNIQDFYNEYLFIYSTSLFNRFPLDFITECIHKFFNEFNPSKLNYVYNQKTYEDLRQRIMTINVRQVCLSMNTKYRHRLCDDDDDDDDNNNNNNNNNILNTETNIKRVKI